MNKKVEAPTGAEPPFSKDRMQETDSALGKGQQGGDGMRQQNLSVSTGRIKKIIVAAILIISIGMLIAVFFWKVPEKEITFVPPALEEHAVKGTPSPEEKMNYSFLETPTGYSVGLCATMYQQEDASLLIYLTNPESNDVNLLCEIKDENGKTLYKSGVILPGEYVEKLQPVTEFPNEAMPIEIFIYGYETDTWYSKGTILLENILQPY